MTFIEIRVIHLHVDRSLSVEMLMVHHPAHAHQHILDLLQTVDPNVQSIQNALATELVYKRNVEILVSDHAVSMRSVLSSIIPHHVHVQS